MLGHVKASARSRGKTKNGGEVVLDNGTGGASQVLFTIKITWPVSDECFLQKVAIFVLNRHNYFLNMAGKTT